MRNRFRILLVLGLAAGAAAFELGLAGCRGESAAAPAARPNDVPASQPVAPAGARFKLPTVGTVFVPAELPAALSELDLVVHFHGAPPTVEREFAAARLRAVLVIVNYRGLSKAYESPFSDAELFRTVLREAREELVERRLAAPDVRWRRVCVSSFSAGFGAVRALLRVPEHYERIDALYLADTVYAGYVDDAGTQRVNPENMRDFRRFAADAVAGRKTLVLTHSYLVPGGYAGTHETADDLLAFTGTPRVACDEAGPSGMRVVSRAHAGSLSAFGCAGVTGEDHMAHLRHMRGWFALLPVELFDTATAPRAGG